MWFAAIFLGFWWHPFHVSVCNIHFKPGERVVQVEYRIFLDDFEAALQRYSGDAHLNIVRMDPEMRAALADRYLKSRFSLSIRQREADLEFIGHELEEQVIWMYYEIQKVKHFDQVQVRNVVLFEIYDDQENIVHFKGSGRVKSDRFLQRAPQRDYQFAW